jgi:NAD(P)-dependent dehydrogenase (short-subunit alcohol dehydrogenase family)
LDLQLKGKRAIVTGGSRGIGKAIAKHLAMEGVDVAIAARGAEQLREVASELGRLTGRRVVPVVADTGQQASVDALMVSVLQALGGVDILVNNAAQPGGISQATSVSEIVDEHLLEDLNVKVVGYLRTARAVAPHLIKQGWGRIINVGGLAFRRTGRPAATIRNVGVAALTKSLSDELAPRGINVSAVHPGATRTERTTEAAARERASGVAIGRIVDASEVACVVAFLASPLSIALTGDTIAVGGGTLGPIHY